MSNLTDYPGNCATNVHILHDFAEIAYIVCTHAIPASTENVTDANSPDKILDRLRNAEKQFRQHSILVALDSDKLELFTFYRKVDVVKDQRTILNKFGYVCRLNSCIISAKSAARVLDLLKPEQSRIYKLFTSAVLSSIHILPRSREKVLPIGFRIYLVPTNSEESAQNGKLGTLCLDWQICRVNLQVIPTGQLLLTLQHAKNALLNLLSDMEQKLGTKTPASGSLVYLFPTGQIARYTAGLAVTKTEMHIVPRLKSNPNQDEANTILGQIRVVSSWLKQRYPSFATQFNQDTRWLQVEIAIFETTNDSAATNNKVLSWKSLMWPSTMVYVFQKTGEFRTLPKQSATELDPLKFALDWYNNSAERSGQLARAQALKDIRDNTDEEQGFMDEVHFEDQYNPQIFGPPIFPASQMVYPTPPEAAITHQTPGMSSVDGMAPTPAPILNVSQPDSEPFLDQEMSDVLEHQPERVGTGFYDEDLFEEMPDDKLPHNAGGDEPNWDFFDPPGFEHPANELAKQEQASDEPASADVQQNTVDDIQEGKDDEFPTLSSPELSKHVGDLLHESDLTKNTPGKIDSVYAQDLTVSPMNIQQIDYVGKSLSPDEERQAMKQPNNQHDINDQSFVYPPTRRRSSVFESVTLNSRADGHDSRYHKHGKFWFDHESSNRTKQLPISHPRKRPTSSGSNTSMSSSNSSSDVSSPTNIQDLHLNKRTWTEYHPESPIAEEQQTDSVSLKQVEADTETLLSTIGANVGEDPFSVRIEPFANARRRPNYNPQKMMMIAQILVDQVSQSFLLRGDYNMQILRREGVLHTDLSIDHSGVSTPIHRATLAELTSIPPRSAAQVLKLDSRLVCVKRADAEIIAKQSIIPFWDTFGLQPYSESKDLTAFCIYPSSTNVFEGCTNFLGRLADTYTSCNFGIHSTGRFAGLTNDGLLAWTPQSASGPNLKQLCQRLGSTIGNPITSIHSTVVVYMVSPSKDAAIYREICHAFTVLFEAFIETSEGMRRNVELVLQIVPLGFVASPDTLVIPSQDDYLELAIEVYNRVPVRQLDVGAASCGSAVILEKHRTRNPSFELVNTVISPLAKDGPCLHLAYSYSPDKRWLTAAWSDERGLVAFTMSYCLNIAKGAKAHPKREVFRSIWDISHDIMSRLRVKWRLVVSYPDFYEAEDVSEWQHLITQTGDERKTMHRLILLSVDLNPDILIEMASTIAKPALPAAVAQVANASGTPATTPQANMTSPDQVVAATPTSGGISHNNAATPPEHHLESGNETDTALIDPIDQCWAILLAYGLNQSSNFTEIRPAAASGLLAKRTGSKDETRNLRLFGVNLVAAPRAPATTLLLSEREAILQEMMEQFRGLITLAISRGCIDKTLECIPWHIATAIKGSRVLGEAM